MKQDTRLSAMLHLLLHMAHSEEPTTSQDLARYMDGNAAAVRRTMAGLRQAGIVASEKGHGGGWRLARPLERITLADIHRALGSPGFFAFGNRSAKPHCLVEQAVNDALDYTVRTAQAQIIARLTQISLADIAADFRSRMERRGLTDHGDHHA